MTIEQRRYAAACAEVRRTREEVEAMEERLKRLSHEEFLIYCALSDKMDGGEDWKNEIALIKIDPGYPFDLSWNSCPLLSDSEKGQLREWDRKIRNWLEEMRGAYLVKDPPDWRYGRGNPCYIISPEDLARLRETGRVFDPPPA